MPRYIQLQNSFQSGQLSKKLVSRTDVKEYAQGLSEMSNFLPYKTGGASLRPGLRNLGITSSGDNPAWRVEFNTGENESYSIRLHFDTATSTLSAGDLTFGTTTVGLGSVSANASAEVAKIYDGGGDITKGWHFAQKDDVLIMVHNSGLGAPIIIYRESLPYTGALTFNVASWQDNISTKISSIFSNRQLRYPIRLNYTDVTMTLDAVSPSTGRTLTCSTSYFTDRHIGAIFVVKDIGSNDSALLEVTATTGTVASPATTATVSVTYVIGTPTTATTWWGESYWSDQHGWPRTITYFQGRLGMGGNASYGSTMWFSSTYSPLEFNQYIYSDPDSTSGSSTDFAPSADKAFNATIAATFSDDIKWMSASRTLLVGCYSKEYAVSSVGGSFSATSIQISPQSSQGSSAVMPVTVDNKVMFISRDGKSIIQFGYSEENGSFISRNISDLSDGMLEEVAGQGARYIDARYQHSRRAVWVRTNTGHLFSITISTDTTSFAFASHLDSNYEVKSLSITSNADSTYDNLVMEVLFSNEDYKDLASTNYTGWPLGENLITCYIGDDFENTALLSSSSRPEDLACYLDFAIVYDKATYFTGTRWEVDQVFANSSVTVMYDDGTVEVVTPKDNFGEVDFPPSKTYFTLTGDPDYIVVGIPYEATLKTLTLDVSPNQNLSSVGDIMRVDRVTALLYKTWDGKYGNEEGTEYDFELESTDFDGKYRIDIPLSPDDENRVIIKNNGPKPISVLGLVLRGQNHP